MSKTKKIISIILFIVIFSFSAIPIANGSTYGQVITSSLFMSTTTLVTSGQVIESALNDSKSYLLEENGYDVEYNLGQTERKTYFTAVFEYDFSDSKYLLGQTYRFSFKLNASQHNNYCICYIPDPDATSYLTPFLFNGLVHSTLYEGENFPSFEEMNEHTISYLEGAPNQIPLLNKSSIQRLWNNNIFTFDINIPSNFYVKTQNGNSTNRLFIYMLMYSNNVSDYVNFLDITLEPIGATKALYQEFEYQENVENELSDINQGLEEQNSQLEDANNKLDEIIGQPEEEKSEAQEGADDALSGILDGVEDKGPGFFRALGGLISAMSYNGTEAKWQVPPIKIPAIDGLWDEIVLTDNQEIDFSFWVNKLPEVLLNFIKALTTCALIVYCFKELYETLSYVFTLKKGE